MKRYYVVEDRSGPDQKWAQCSTYDNRNDARDRLRYEAAHVYYPDAVEQDTLILLNSSRLKTASGYEMRIDAIDCYRDEV